MISSENIISNQSDPKNENTPKKNQNGLKREAQAWDSSIAKEKPEGLSRLLDKAEFFVAHRPPRQPVPVRLDPFDLALLKRIARNKGLPFTPLMSMWLHEKVGEEKNIVIS